MLILFENTHITNTITGIEYDMIFDTSSACPLNDAISAAASAIIESAILNRILDAIPDLFRLKNSRLISEYACALHSLTSSAMNAGS